MVSIFDTKQELVTQVLKLRGEVYSAKADLEFYKGLHANQKESILSLYAKLDEAEAARDEATARATHAEEELAVASWLAQENLRCCELRDTLIDTQREALLDMQERATNAEYNAKHYWRELQAETNKARMYRQERDFERRRYDEVARSKGAPLPHTMRIGNFTIASNAALGG